MNIELQINELILHGFAPGDRYRIGEAVEHELTRLLQVQGVPPSLATDGEIAHIDAGNFEMATGTKANTVGTRVAQMIHQGVSR